MINFESIKSDKKIRTIVIAIAAAVILLLAGLAVYGSGLGPVDKSDDEPITVTIPQGSGAMNIIDILDETGLVKNKTMAKIHMKLGGYDSLQANTYIFSKDMGLKRDIEGYRYRGISTIFLRISSPSWRGLLYLSMRRLSPKNSLILPKTYWLYGTTENILYSHRRLLVFDGRNTPGRHNVPARRVSVSGDLYNN